MNLNEDIRPVVERTKVHTDLDELGYHQYYNGQHSESRHDDCASAYPTFVGFGNGTPVPEDL